LKNVVARTSSISSRLGLPVKGSRRIVTIQQAIAPYYRADYDNQPASKIRPFSDGVSKNLSFMGAQVVRKSGIHKKFLPS
jgi:hypothetical protein